MDQIKILQINPKVEIILNHEDISNIYDYLLKEYDVRTASILNILREKDIEENIQNRTRELEDVIKVEDIAYLCKKIFRVKMYVINLNENVVYHYNPEVDGVNRKKSKRNLMFVMNEENIIQSITHEKTRNKIMRNYNPNMQNMERTLNTRRPNAKHNTDIQTYNMSDDWFLTATEEDILTTEISSDKYRDIRELLRQPISKIIRIVPFEKCVYVKRYLQRWLFKNHYMHKKMEGNLTSRILNCMNNEVYYYGVVENCFDNFDVIERNVVEVSDVFGTEYFKLVEKLNLLHPSLFGTFMENLVRTMMGKNIEHINISGNALTNVFLYTLKHSYFGLLNFGEKPEEQEIKDKFISMFEEPDTSEIFYKPLKRFCMEIIENKDTSSVDFGQGCCQGLECVISEVFPAAYDLAVEDALYEIKCTRKPKPIYETLQLLSYASMMRCNPTINKKINVISVIDLYRGRIVGCDISSLTMDQMMRYLKF
jgi:hypothetical protein